MPTAADSSSPQGLQAIIAPEVFGDEFSEAIRNLARSAPIDSVLEIGSSSGEGSTLAWVEGLRQNPRKPKLYCMEVSKVRCEALERRWGPEGFVECFLGSSVDLDQFPTEAEVEKFYHTVDGPLRKYPLEQVLGWLREDKAYITSEGVQTGRIREIKRSRGIENFGAVLIDGSEFTGNAELDEVYGAEFILLDDTQTYKCHQAHQRLLHDPAYQLIAENPSLRHGYSVFRRRRRTALDPLPDDAPVHYFTIVLNGEPFIRHHIEVLKQLSFPWHWHIVEGAATLTHDTGAWGRAEKGALNQSHHRNGLSTDGTSAYLDELAALYPERVTIYRPPGGRLWDGKTEMVAQPLKNIFEEGILWEIDADELWTQEQLETGRRMFLEHPEKCAAWFWCHFFVGEKLVVASRYGYSQKPTQEWIRAWKFTPGMKWLTHEPPVLARRLENGQWKDVADGRVFSHQETEALGLVFQHFAYATEAQVQFKESYYGYAGAVAAWHKLQNTQTFPTPLREHFAWVEGHAEVDTIEARRITPLARYDRSSNRWTFSSHAAALPSLPKHTTTIVVDGVFFQLNNTGIGRVWSETLKLWAASDMARHVWILDRNGTLPPISGLRRISVKPFNIEEPGSDAFMLQDICDELKADVFISTYYTAPISTPTVAMIYDMIPELLSYDPHEWQWEQKRLSISHAVHFACISDCTAKDLRRLHPEISESAITVTPLAAAPSYRPASAEAIADFRRRHGIHKDYLMLAGERAGYKNAALIFKAWSLLPKEERDSLMFVCAGGKPELEHALRVHAPDAEVRVIRFSDEDLATAFTGAVALGYPSLYEGFGLPVLEGMACGCPVITTRRASLVQVAGDAAIFVDPWDPHATLSAIRMLRSDKEQRQRYIEAGLAHAATFSFEKMATQLSRILLDTAATAPKDESGRLESVWKETRLLQLRTSDLIAKMDKVKWHLAKRTEEAKTASSALKKSQKQRTKAEKLLKAERQKRKNPLKRLWNKLRGKKKS